MLCLEEMQLCTTKHIAYTHSSLHNISVAYANPSLSHRNTRTQHRHTQRLRDGSGPEARHCRETRCHLNAIYNTWVHTFSYKHRCGSYQLMTIQQEMWSGARRQQNVDDVYEHILHFIPASQSQKLQSFANVTRKFKRLIIVSVMSGRTNGNYFFSNHPPVCSKAAPEERCGNTK